MADSNITKKALANSLKELMTEVPFEKINVSQICERCDMNRKSFYYHFKDKYDLVNWIFDMEFLPVLTDENINHSHTNEDHWHVIELVFQLFYENRTFYRSALKIKGQNSFSDHFRECIHPILKKRIELIMNIPATDTFTVNFFSDAYLCALERWLSERDCMPPEQIAHLLKHTIERFAISVCNELEDVDCN